MVDYTQHTIYLQDGSLCNFRKRIWKHAKPLVVCFERIIDPRCDRGKRHELSLMVFILFAAITTGCTTLKDCHLWALHNKPFLRKYFQLFHGIPDPTTISYLVQKLHPDELIKVYSLFLTFLGIPLGTVLSFDGKTMRGVTGDGPIRHILSLFAHMTHTVLSQIGVTQKENEIPAFKKFLEKLTAQQSVKGYLFLADALHAQKDTAKAILMAGADYLLVVKGNQKDLLRDILFSLTSPQRTMHVVVGAKNSFMPITEVYSYAQTKRKRYIATTVTTTTEPELVSYIQQTHGWNGIRTVGMLKRTGTRETKDGTSVPIDETIGIVSSKILCAKQMAELLRGHWCIENNLHWVKDFVFLEDRQTLRSGNAPQIMSFLRSMCISLCNLMQFQSISDALHNFQKSKTIHHQFLKMAAIV